MDEEFSDSSGLVFLPDDHIRSVQINLQAQLEGFRKTSPAVNFIETQSVCENVKDKILNSEDESQLSKIHNNSRRISIASELFIGICSIYSFIVDCEFTKIIDTLIQWKKYDYISKKIRHKMRSELKKEKYFEKEAQSKLQKSIQGDDRRPLEGPEEIPKPVEGTETTTRDAVTQEEKSPQKERQRVDAAEATQTDEINKVMRLTAEHSTRDEISNAVGNITVMRAESPNDPSLLHIPDEHLETGMNSLVTSIPEIPIQETSLQEKDKADISKILQILEGDIVEREIDEMPVPETFLETTVAVGESSEKAVEKLPAPREDFQMEQLDTEEWELPDVEPEKTTKKKHHHVIIDETITIHNYSERALYMNSNIKIQRVQVFEGPPTVLQAMSASHLMKTSSFKTSLFQDVRSSKLNKLFERYLMVEKKPVESITVPQMRAVEDKQEIRFPRTRPSEEQVEDIAARAGMYSLPGRGDVLVETEKEKTHLEQTEISGTGVHVQESLIGMPVSRIISPTAAAPPDLDKINNVSVSYTPRVQQLQGQSLDPGMHSSWFHSTKKNPPNAKYREFNYVYAKVQEYWSLFEVQGMKKSITLREFFAFETDGNVANFLTVLRILDKLSIQRKLLLTYQNHEVVIEPFESPFVSEKQLQIKGKEPIL